MADKRISELNTITGANTADDDLFVIVDSSAGETKKITRSELGNAFDSLNVSGTVTADGLTVEVSNSSGNIYEDYAVQITNTDTTAGSMAGIRLTQYGAINPGDSYIYSETPFNHASDLYFATEANSANAVKDRVKIAYNGDISFYEDTGTTAKFFWDASAERLGLGTTVPSHNIDVTSSQTASLRLDSTTYNADFILYSGATGADKFGIYDNDASAYRLIIDNVGNVGIGTSSPNISAGASGSTALTVSASTANDSNRNGLLELRGTRSATGGVVSYVRTFNNSGATPITDIRSIRGSSDTTGELTFETSGSEAMRIDSSGTFRFAGAGTPGSTEAVRFSGSAPASSMILDSLGTLLLGKTASGTATPGFQVAQDGFTGVTRDLATANSSEVFRVNRENTDGTIIDLRKDNVTVGSIGNISGNIYIGNGGTGLGASASSNTLYPISVTSGAIRDGGIDLGISAARFKDIYATNGTIQTSDRNEKQDIEELSEAEQRVAVAAKGLLRKFRWKDAVEEKGDDARIHFGIIAQDLQAAFEAEGLDAGRYAMFIHSTWTDEETGEERSRMGVRYSELLAFIIAAI